MSLFKNTGHFLLFHTGCPCSTIGATELNFRVRDGIGWNLCAIVTGKLKWIVINKDIDYLYDQRI